MNKVPITAQGLKNLRQELERLVGTERPAVIRAIAEAREHGDLSENAEYHAAREKQSFIEGKIKELQGKVANAQVIETEKLDGKQVKFGATVTIAPKGGAGGGATAKWQLVGDDEADIGGGRLGIGSPLAKAMVGLNEGDEFNLKTPAGNKVFTIKKVGW